MLFLIKRVPDKALFVAIQLCCSDDRLLQALIDFTKAWIKTDDESLVRAVCINLWRGCTISRTMKNLWDWAGEADPRAKKAIIEDTLTTMAKGIVLGRIALATTSKGVGTRVSLPFPLPLSTVLLFY